MSLRDDVVLRVIHQLVEALLRAVGLRKKRDFAGAEQAIGDGLTGLGLSLDVITRLDPDTLVALLGDKRALVAVALIELGNVRAAEGRAEEGARLREVGTLLLERADDVPDELKPFATGGGEGGALLMPAQAVSLAGAGGDEKSLSTTPEDARMPW